MIIKSVLLDRKRFYLTSDDINHNDNIYTVIIGVNGTGKSRLLQRITHNFKSSSEQNINFKIPQNYANHIEFEHGKKDYVIYSRAGINKSYIGDKEKNYSTFKPNTKVIAVTTSPFDKFPVEYKGNAIYKHHDDDLYHYIGLRVSENSYNKSNFMHLLARSFIKNGIGEKQKTVLRLLGYESKSFVTFKYKIPLNYLFSHGGLIDHSISQFKKILQRYHPSLFTNIHKNNKDEIVDVIYKSLHNTFYDFYRGIVIDSDFSKNKDLLTLLDLGIIQVKDILLNKEGGSLSISQASSGQQCILLTILNISGVIRNNSIICIDEPEISLHPQWQKRFMNLLMKCFDNYKKCHFIISTHSPLIISELKSNNCYILNMDSGKAIKSDYYIDKSADYQLVELFDEPGVNNEYLNRIVVSLLSKLSKQGKLNIEDKKQAKMLFKTSEKLEDHDTVKDLILILSEALEKVKK
ncbi:AAA family ATPase [Photobacterium makurazakiensis]|uniref:AAA family ATPase n=1 Tax=Photobacterium makurazakiensis TaxID=2910234 RepID=UPI003D10478A